MSTATVSQTIADSNAKNEIQLTAHEARAENLRINGDKPLVALTGNGFVVRKLLWVLGGTYDKTTKTNLIPEHNREKAQAAIDSVNAKIKVRIEQNASATATEAPKADKPKAAKASKPKALKLARNQPKATTDSKVLADRKALIAQAKAAKEAAATK